MPSDISQLEFQLALQEYISLVWENEVAFLSNFMEYPDYDEVELLEFYMGDTQCNAVVMSADGRTLNVRIPTIEYLEWAENILLLSS